jgi:hypothetical protein
MAEVGMDERIGDERPDVGCPPSGPSKVGEDACVVTCGNESKEQQKLGRLFGAQCEHEHELNEREDGKQRDYGRRYVEHPFAAGLIEHVGAGSDRLK